MNIKKMVSAVVSAAMMLASASSLALSANATLLPIPTYEASVNLNPHTVNELKSIKLGEIIDGLVFSEDVVETIAWDDLTEEQKAAYREENGLPVVDESAETEAPSDPGEVTTSSPDHDLDLGQTNLPETVEIITHKEGEKVEVAADAKFVWIEGEKYSILDRDAEINLSKYYSSSKTIGIIIGSGKQLDPSNIMYNARIAITVVRPVYDYTVSFYTMNGDEKVALPATKSSSNSTKVYYYPSEGLLRNNETVYAEVSASAKSSYDNSPIDGTFKITYAGSDNKMYSYSDYQRLRANITFTYNDASGIETVETQSLYVYLYTASIEIYSYTKGNEETEWNINGYSKNCTYTGENHLSCSNKGTILSGSAQGAIKFSYIYLMNKYINSNYIKAYVGNYSTLDEVKDLEDIFPSLGSSNGYTFDIGESFEKLDITLAIAGKALSGKIPGLEGKTILVNYTMTPAFYEKPAASETEETEEPVTPEEPVEPEVPVIPEEPEESEYPDTPIYDLTNAYFELVSVMDTTDNYLNNYIDVTCDYDTYFKHHYQTRLIYDADNSVDMSRLMLEVESPADVKVYNSVKSHIVKFTEDPQDFTGKTVQYSVAAPAGTGNYFVTLAKNTNNGPDLFVSGPDEREIFLDSFYGDYHDILIANIGNEPLTGLKVEWVEEPVNVKIDEYWTVGGENNDTLAAFTTTEKPANLAKIRLIPTSEEGGDIKGTLKISAANGQSRTIKLTGHAGDPKIVTESPIVNGVKFVPYNAIIATDNVHSWIRTYYDYEGFLPFGVELDYVTGEIYGVPQETGIFDFTVYAIFESPEDSSSSGKDFVLEILDNTNMNVYMASDEDYTIQTAIGVEQTALEYDFVLDLLELDNDQLFVSNGVYGDFIDLWINGERMLEGEDYTSESGSTRITIKSQTLKKLPQKETITLAAEFRVGGDLKNDLKRTAQNFKIDISEVHDNSKPSGGGSGSGSGSGSIVYPGGGGSHVPSLPDDEENTSHITTGNNHNHVELSDTAANSTAIKLAIALINKISTDPALINPDDVAAARAAYDKLPADSKSAVTNYDKLVAAEEAIKASVPAEEPPADTDNTPAETEDTPAETEETPAETEETPAETEDAPAETEDAPAEAEGVEFSARIVDAEGNPYANIYVELHSVVQTAYTDDDGCFAFDSVEYGEHTLTVTDEATGETASITFVISDDETEIFMDLMFDGSELTMLSGAEDGSDDNTDSDPADSTDNTGSADVDDDYDNVPTGISGSAVCLVLSSAAFVITLLPKKKRED